MKKIIPLLLSGLLVLAACGEKEEMPEEEKDAPIVIVEPPPLADTNYDASNEDAFEYTIWSEYRHLATQVPKNVSDSALGAINAAAQKNPRLMKKMIEEELARHGRKQDTLARYTIHEKYNISYDSIQAILDEMQAKRDRGEIDE